MLIDNHNRVINYVRLAVTDRCNLRCNYCMPEHGIDFARKSDLMTVEEMKVFVCQSMMTLADALERSTQDEKAAGAIRGFTSELAERIGVGPGQEN